MRVEPIEKAKAVAEIVAILTTAAVTYVAYDSQLDGAISRYLSPTLRRIRSQVEGIVGAFFDGRAVIGQAQSFCCRPLPPRGLPWPDADDR